jgi:flagellar motility protein MotE (MotC chaperone)
MNKMILLGATLSAVFSASVFAQATVEQVMSEGEKRADAGAAEQRRVEQIADQTADLLNDYNTVSKVVDGLVTYNALLQRQIDNQNQEMAALNESIRNVSLIERQILPMMTRMLDSLEVFIELDTPFLIKERQERLERLRGMMERSDVSAAEKFRRVIEAYQIENDYGRTIEAYKDTVEIDGVAQEADFLRIGRVSLAYQTVGGGTTGAWDKDAGQFVKLDDSEFKNQVAHGLKVARKQVAPDLLVVPVPAASEE